MLRDLLEKFGSMVFLVIIEMLAGGIILYFGIQLIEDPILLVLMPALMSLRGNIVGPYAVRLVNALNLGETEPRFLTPFNTANAAVALSLSILATSAVFLATAGLGISLNIAVRNFSVLLFVALVTSTVSTLVMVPLIIAVSNLLYRRGFGLENFLPAFVTGLMDFLTPLLLFATIGFVHRLNSVQIITLSLVLNVFGVLLLFLVVVARKDFTSVIKENFTVSTIAAMGSGLGGVILATNPEIAVGTGVVGVLPALNSLVGASLGTVATLVSVDLHLFGSSKFRKVVKNAVALILAVILSVALLSALLIVLSHTALKFYSIDVAVILSALTATPLVIVALTVVAYLLSIHAFKVGLDPSNITFPVMTALGDLLTPLAVTLTLHAIILLT